MVGPTSTRPKGQHRTANRAMAKAQAEMTAMKDSSAPDNWARAEGRHFVCLFDHCHVQVYGAPSEVRDGRQFSAAASSASAFLRAQFGGDAQTMAEFVRWVWQREIGREKWRRENGREGGRIGWRLQFSAGMVTDWRVDRARKNGTA